MIFICGECGKKIDKYEPDLKQRLKRSKSGKVFCDHDCRSEYEIKARVAKLELEIVK